MKTLTVSTPHPDSHIEHPAHTGVGRIWPFPGKLWMVTVLSNPLRFKNRYHNYWKFLSHMEASCVSLITVEIAFGGRHFEITEPGNPMHVQLRTTDELWVKEVGINLGIQRIPLGTPYFGYSDADLIFTRPDWAQETLHQLQHYDAVQLFSSYSDLDSNFAMGRPLPSFCHNYLLGHCIPPGHYGSRKVGAPGGAWAFRREAFDALGGLLDICILGSGDWHMAYGLAGRDDYHADILKGSPAYVKSIHDWQQRAAILKRNIGCVPCHALHHWHGAREHRHYITRPKILIDNGYDPTVDIRRNFQGVYELVGNKPMFRDALRAYFRSRHEDRDTIEQE